ncbi:hypothetical protein [uncultured Spirosoma sp.]|uniref:hypothetical protein n=1 Tax=uncultured Spirosoma sp. TaxID=278208 RepID=UPI002587D54E|nr:hypothetical protein [uncultured Spirosoma sp.]
MNDVLSAEPGCYKIGRFPVPRPVFFFLVMLVLITGLKAVTGGLGAAQPDNVAMAVGEGLMSVLHDDKGLKNLVLIFSKDGRNHDGTVELRDFGAGLGSMFFGGGMRAGGKLYFHQYRHSSGVILDGGPLDVELSNADAERTSRLRVQGNVHVSGVEQPGHVQLEFISPGESYSVEQIEGKVQLRGKINTL